MTPSEQNGLDRLLDDLTGRLPCVRYAVILSADGLPRSRSTDMTFEDAEHFCALAAVLHNVAGSAGIHFRVGNARQSVIELDRGYLVVAAAGAHTCLAVLTVEAAAMGKVTYEVNRAVQRLAWALPPG
ncbi:roadblock/LC7 domain-containing protein [Nocardia brasiliensis]|uniref:roadblock/LC7 domain-containing protein n=1 Tax=Nocardia brasiliensis TaxID=37326 RepID=UPI0024555964|nr:roadblock/LC7 domain-containing protein [Nocardia brasiliensis]